MEIIPTALTDIVGPNKTVQVEYNSQDRVESLFKSSQVVARGGMTDRIDKLEKSEIVKQTGPLE